MLKAKFPFSKLAGKKVNTLIFPNLESANITYKMLKELYKVDSVGQSCWEWKNPFTSFSWALAWKKWSTWQP
jgi:phosphotransacetylase